MQIFAPYHAPHLYTRDDCQRIVHCLDTSDCQTNLSFGLGSTLRVPLISSATGNIVDARDHNVDFTTLLESAAEQILLQPIHWDPVLATLLTRLEINPGKTPLRIIPVATTADQLIYTGLRQRNALISLPERSTESHEPECTTSTGATSPSNRDNIAIIGMAGRLPEAATTDALWDIIRLGFDVSKEVPPLRWNSKTHVDPSGRKKNSSRTSLGCWLNDPDVFDADFFGISALEATRMDPAQRLALMTTYEAIEQAGIVWPNGVDGAGATSSTRPDRVGVYYGVSGNDWRDCNAAQKLDSHFVRASNRAFISARISEAFKLNGPSLTVDTSSSTSLAPVHMACSSLQAQETDMCIVGGAHVMTNPNVHTGLDRAGLLSRMGNCKVFDETADGLCRGEGVVSLVLKRLEDALAENDSILGVVPAVATKCSRPETPGKDIMSAIFTEVLDRSNVDPTSVLYVEMGGSCANDGDAGHLASALDILAPISASSSLGKRSTVPLFLGSATANIGYGEATSGLSGMIKLLLMLRENVIPPHIGIQKQVNSKLPADEFRRRNIQIHTGKAIKWRDCAGTSSHRERRRALVYDQGMIACASSALLVEENPHQDQGQGESTAVVDCAVHTDASTSYIIAISAKSKTSLHRNMTNLYLWLQKESSRDQSSLAQLSFTTTARRNHYSHRAMLVASSFQELCVQLHAKVQQSRVELKSPSTDVKSIDNPVQANADPQVVFAFLGSQMGNFASSSSAAYFRRLYDSFSLVRQETDHLEQILKCLGLPSIMKPLGFKGDSASCQHNETQYSYNGFRMHQMAEHLAHMCTHMVLSKLWRSWGIHPIAIVTGDGLDVYTALNVAGVLSDADTILLAGAYTQGEFLQRAREETLDSGQDSETVIAADFERLCGLTTYHKPRIPIFRLMTDRIHDQSQRQNMGSASPRLDVVAGAGEDSQVFLTRQALPRIKPNNLNSNPADAPTKGDLMIACRESTVIPDQSIIQEMGPEAPTLCGSTPDDIKISFADGAQVYRNDAGIHLSKEKSNRQMWSHLTTTLRKLYDAGANIHWDQFHRDLPLSSRRVISTVPAYSWDLKEYWVPYRSDWTLFKGDACKTIVAPKLESTTIHTIIEETELMGEDENGLRLVVEADISRDDLHGIVQGHVVDGVPLCTPVCDVQHSNQETPCEKGKS